MEEEQKVRSDAAGERGELALECAIAQHREKIQHYLDNGQATQAVEAYERLFTARRRLADWQQRTTHVRASQ